jgi:hypothetical protein
MNARVPFLVARGIRHFGGVFGPSACRWAFAAVDPASQLSQWLLDRHGAVCGVRPAAPAPRFPIAWLQFPVNWEDSRKMSEPTSGGVWKYPAPVSGSVDS